MSVIRIRDDDFCLQTQTAIRSHRINNLLSVYFDTFTHYTGADICDFF